MRKFALIILLICLQLSELKSQTRVDTFQRYQRLDLSFIFGGQIYNNNFIYNPGFSFQTSYGIRLNESVSVGLGAGYTGLQDEHFIPVFFEAMGCRKNKANSPVITMQMGYSWAWHSGNLLIEGYKFGGGVYIDAGLGRKIAINNSYSLFFHWSYRHQFARMEYEVFGDQKFSQSLNYDMLVITLGIIRSNR